jgi:N-acetylmuramoyl-L-alanine amidase
MPKILALLLCLAPALAWGARIKVEGVRLSAATGHTRVVLNLSGAAKHTLFTLKNPDRVVIDLAATELATTRFPAGGVVADIRSAPHGSNLRVVLDLTQAITPRAFVMPGDSQGTDSLVVDLYAKGTAPSAARASSAPRQPVKQLHAASGPGRDLVVAIDAGHGGIDPGAIGPHGVEEKTVTLAIARKLAADVRAEPGMKPYLTRDCDCYLHLRERIKRARKAHADIFISIHADASRDPRADGSTVYALSLHGASSEAARWLANRENDADLVGGVSLQHKSSMLASVLLDLSQTATIRSSLTAGKRVLNELGTLGPLHRDSMQQAAFVVLKSPDVPSILVETDYITNPHEARLLMSSSYQRKIAHAILGGIKSYFNRYPPPGTLLAKWSAEGIHPHAKNYVVSSGDTLSGIANQFNISLDSLRAANDLSGDTIQPGESLAIPAAG